MSPSTVRAQTVPVKAARSMGSVQTARVDPAQLTVRTFSSSESTFSIYLAARSDVSRPRAPSMPTSSSTVNKHSRGPWGISSPSKTARAMATAMPSSPPRVVPRAPTVSPSTKRSNPSFSMSLGQSASFSATMSMWPWIMTAGACS